MSPVERERQLRLLMTLRVVIVTTLLVCAFGIEFLLRPALTLRPLFTLAAISYGMVLLYAVADRWIKGTAAFTLLQLVGDALMITFFVGITGGIDSPMSFLYLLPISVASALLYRNGGLAIAGICWAMYGTLAIFGPDWWPMVTVISRQHETGRVIYFLVAHLVAMVAFALLSSYLSERLRVQGRELDERRGTVARLKALNENIIRSINSGLLTTNLSGRINFMNRGGSEILGFTQREVEEVSVEALFGFDRGYLDEVRKQLLAERRFRFERWFDSKTGERIFLGIAASNLHDKSGQPLGFLFIFQDLTEIHALEQEFRLNERMAALGEMAAGMAHELRNPLAAISGSVQYLKGDLKPQGEQLELMDIIMRESDRLDQAIKDFLTFARPGRFAPEPTDLVKLIGDNVKLLLKSNEFTSGHRVETGFSASRLECEVDPNRVKQIFWNLATNALKSMPGGGTLHISAGFDDTGRELELSFSDQGTGMDDEQRKRYFQPFSSSFREGTGLGAAIVYRLVQEHGGRILLDSSVGEGTTVRIVIPRLARATQPTVVEEPRLQAVGGQGR